jgi:hypothetical protein
MRVDLERLADLVVAAAEWPWGGLAEVQQAVHRGPQHLRLDLMGTAERAGDGRPAPDRRQTGLRPNAAR